MRSIKEILMERDSMSSDEADELITQAKDDLFERLDHGEMSEDICMEWFGLEPDYLFELI